MATNTNTSTTHKAALCTAKGTPLSVSHRPTPIPGPGQVLIHPHAVALNVVDAYMRDLGFSLETFPAVLGSDVAGTIVATGPPETIPDFLRTPGTRVTAFASAFYEQGRPDHGAFQERVLVSADAVSPIPDDLGWAQAATLPMVVLVALSAWDMFSYDYLSPDVDGNKHEAVLVWGAATGIGTMAVQTAKMMGYTVVATASEQNHEYLKGLGADVVYDYHDKEAVQKSVVEFVRGREGLQMKNCFFGQGDLTIPQAILKELDGESGGSFIAHAPPLLPGTGMVDGVNVEFLAPKPGKEARDAQQRTWFNVYLKEKLASGEGFRSCPEVKVVGEGLESIDQALTDLREKGVRCVKPVVILQK